jgi:hypothetical protein
METFYIERRVMTGTYCFCAAFAMFTLVPEYVLPGAANIHLAVAVLLVGVVAVIQFHTTVVQFSTTRLIFSSLLVNWSVPYAEIRSVGVDSCLRCQRMRIVFGPDGKVRMIGTRSFPPEMAKRLLALSPDRQKRPKSHRHSE